MESLLPSAKDFFDAPSKLVTRAWLASRIIDRAAWAILPPSTEIKVKNTGQCCRGHSRLHERNRLVSLKGDNLRREQFASWPALAVFRRPWRPPFARSLVWEISKHFRSVREDRRVEIRADGDSARRLSTSCCQMEARFYCTQEGGGVSSHGQLLLVPAGALMTLTFRPSVRSGGVPFPIFLAGTTSRQDRKGAVFVMLVEIRAHQGPSSSLLLSREKVPGHEFPMSEQGYESGHMMSRRPAWQTRPMTSSPPSVLMFCYDLNDGQRQVVAVRRPSGAHGRRLAIFSCRNEASIVGAFGDAWSGVGIVVGFGNIVDAGMRRRSGGADDIAGTADRWAWRPDMVVLPAASFQDWWCIKMS